MLLCGTQIEPIMSICASQNTNERGATWVRQDDMDGKGKNNHRDAPQRWSRRRLASAAASREVQTLISPFGCRISQEFSRVRTSDSL